MTKKLRVLLLPPQVNVASITASEVTRNGVTLPPEEAEKVRHAATRAMEMIKDGRLPARTSMLEEFLKTEPSVSKKCACGQVMSDAEPLPARIIAGEEVCGDCQSDAISDLIDEHPIGRPMITRLK